MIPARFGQSITARTAPSRREMLLRCGGGLGAIALAPLLGDMRCEAAEPTWDTVHDSYATAATRVPPFVPRAKHVIHLFMGGGPSHVDTFDPKPALAKHAGQLVSNFESLMLGQGGTSAILF